LATLLKEAMNFIHEMASKNPGVTGYIGCKIPEKATITPVMEFKSTGEYVEWASGGPLAQDTREFFLKEVEHRPLSRIIESNEIMDLVTIGNLEKDESLTDTERTIFMYLFLRQRSHLISSSYGFEGLIFLDDVTTQVDLENFKGFINREFGLFSAFLDLAESNITVNGYPLRETGMVYPEDPLDKEFSGDNKVNHPYFVDRDAYMGELARIKRELLAVKYQLDDNGNIEAVKK